MSMFSLYLRLTIFAEITFFSLEYFIFQLDEVLTFGITERGIVNRLKKELKSSNEAYEKKANELEAEKTNHRKSKDRYHVINMI